MKKILAILLLSTFAISAQAKEVVPVVYSWSAGDPAANFDRAIISVANASQDKYTFIFEAKPGGGGVVPAQYTLSTPNAILATSSAFFIRPVIYPNESYDLSQFRGLAPKCTVTSIITSAKYKTWKDVPKDQPLTIGVSGLGTTTHVIALQIAARYPNMTVVPFKGTSEALINVLNGSIDFAVNFFGDIESWKKDNFTGKTIYTLGVTGDKSFEGIPTLASQGFNQDLAKMSPPHQYVTSTKMPDEKFREIRDIIQKAEQSVRVKDAFFIDRCEPAKPLSEQEVQQWYVEQTAIWRKLSSGIKIK